MQMRERRKVVRARVVVKGNRSGRKIGQRQTFLAKPDCENDSCVGVYGNRQQSGLGISGTVPEVDDLARQVLGVHAGGFGREGDLVLAPPTNLCQDLPGLLAAQKGSAVPGHSILHPKGSRGAFRVLGTARRGRDPPVRFERRQGGEGTAAAGGGGREKPIVNEVLVVIVCCAPAVRGHGDATCLYHADDDQGNRAKGMYRQLAVTNGLKVSCPTTAK